MDPAKVEAVQLFKAPENVKQVQQFLCICNYCRRFIKDFTKVSQPIATLVCKDTPFIWSSDCELAFTTLKSLLLANPIFRQPDVSRYTLMLLAMHLVQFLLNTMLIIKSMFVSMLHDF
jgi:hypothetical protein